MSERNFGIFLKEGFKKDKIVELGSEVAIELDHFCDRSSKTLSDGTKVKWGDKVGWFHISPVPISSRESALKYTRRVKTSILSAFVQLAVLCKTDERLREVKAFGGFSHLALHAEKYGFDTFIVNDFELVNHKIREARKTVKRSVGGNAFLEALTSRRFNHPLGLAEALISRDTLIRLFTPAKD